MRLVRLVPAMCVAGSLLVGLGLPAAAAAPPAGPGAPQASAGALNFTGQVKLCSCGVPGTVAQGPDDSFFFASGKIVREVKGLSAPVVVLHASGPVMALAASANDLYVETGKTIDDYAMPTMGLRHSWTLPSVVMRPTFAGLLAEPGILWSWSDWATDASGFEYATVVEIITGSSLMRVIDTDAYPGDMAAGPDGLYYEATYVKQDPMNPPTYLVHASPDGTLKHSPRTADSEDPLALGPGWVAIGAHRGSSYQPYLDVFSTSTLRRVATSLISFATSWGQSPRGGGLVADAPDGDVLTIDGNSVVSLQPTTGTITSSVGVPGASLLLYGSQPSVVASHLGVSYLVRLDSAGHTAQLRQAGGGPVAPAKPQAAAPAGLARFSPVSATYISASTGWVLGTTTCASACGLVLLRTVDDGAHWVSVRLPVDKVNSDAQSAGPLQIRFADSNDGWLWATIGSVTGDVTGWSTHNGGGSWSKLSFPGTSPGIEDIEASDGFVHAALQVGDSIQIVSSPVTADRWHRTGGPYELGAGPVPQGQFALQGAAGWFVENDRVVISGGRLSPSGHWQKWAPPCATKGGPAILAAPSPNRLDAVCTEGPWTAPASQPPSVHFLTSGNAGSTFSELSRPPGNSAYAASAIGSGTVAVAVSQPHYSGVVLVMSFDGGQSWHTVYRHGGLGTYLLGFTTPSQGIAIIASVDDTPDLMLQTRDGGHTWAPVSFG